MRRRFTRCWRNRSAPDNAKAVPCCRCAQLGLLGVNWSLAGLGALATAVGRKDTPVDLVPVFLILAFCILATGLALLLVAGMLLAATGKVFSTCA